MVSNEIHLSSTKLTFVFEESTYTIYLHKDTMSRNNEKRQNASFNMKYAMRLVQKELNAYDESIAGVVRTWFVVI